MVNSIYRDPDGLRGRIDLSSVERIKFEPQNPLGTFCKYYMCKYLWDWKSWICLSYTYMKLSMLHWLDICTANGIEENVENK